MPVSKAQRHCPGGGWTLLSAALPVDRRAARQVCLADTCCACSIGNGRKIRPLFVMCYARSPYKGLIGATFWAISAVNQATPDNSRRNPKSPVSIPTRFPSTANDDNSTPGWTVPTSPRRRMYLPRSLHLSEQ